MYNAHTFGHAVEISEPWIPYFHKKLSLKIIKTLFLLNQKSRISAGWTPFSAGLVKTLAPSQNQYSFNSHCFSSHKGWMGSTQHWPVSCIRVAWASSSNAAFWSTSKLYWIEISGTGLEKTSFIGSGTLALSHVQLCLSAYHWLRRTASGQTRYWINAL